jgi:hypothetical protein
VLRDHGVIVFATPTAGVRLAIDVAGSEGNSGPELTGRLHEKFICLQSAMPNLPSDFDYSATGGRVLDKHHQPQR